jgi:hypothetical protein
MFKFVSKKCEFFILNFHFSDHNLLIQSENFWTLKPRIILKMFILSTPSFFVLPRINYSKNYDFVPLPLPSRYHF